MLGWNMNKEKSYEINNVLHAVNASSYQVRNFKESCEQNDLVNNGVIFLTP